MLRRLFLAMPILSVGCRLFYRKPEVLPTRGTVHNTPSGFTFRWVGSSERYASPAEVSLAIETEFTAFVKRWMNAIRTEEWIKVSLLRFPIQLYPDDLLPSGHCGYIWDNPLQIDIAMDAKGYDKHFEERTLTGLQWLAHEWRHVLGEKHP